ncbi:MAG: WbuC family cupin fold metalloprotein [Desulfobacterales bacterium]|jgi:cupin fold WbuC family metalloprotein|nr:WbuC family cupin fold metalloprotein [Desulfobacterales bacterium]MDP6808209.1 WbuC family cupin fold metalloprotein [Desulfobacterales bacterium]|tara:strand:+ start:15409 stop:15936 length:528 start_codon:yes stop_codon:yes gene_type:complete
MKWVKKNDEVFYPAQANFKDVTKQDIDFLIQVAQTNPRHRARYCTHSSVDDEVHEMIIYHKEGTYIRPHKHIRKTESFLLLDGKAEVLIFGEEGDLTLVRNLGKYEDGKSFYYRIPESRYHAQIFRKDTVFHEVTKGPFNRNDTVEADWAPDEKETDMVKRYMDEISQRIKSLNS